ncbi:VCBS repeat-containing protein [Streptomyces sp. NPDC050504]|uniref:VCBS repeat-containing protein n=1 Tax=Streptomyces sp. NPDC050504 TaxID=3365618 RepID=UPI0037981DA5
MPSSTPLPGRARPWRALLAGAVAAGLTAAAPAAAIAVPSPAPDAAPRPTTGEGAPSASARAVASGEQVEVIAERTERSTTYANPSGTFTRETHSVPIRVRQAGKLVDADPTLVKAADGTVRPKATSVGMEFSGGGDAPMATVSRDGRSMTMDWAGKLPEPTLSGDTATYPEVLPGVDLKLRASVTGYQQLLVVKNREAAARPELKKLRFDLDSEGVAVRADAAGNLTAVNPAGQTVFTAPTPSMWDSSGVPADAPAAATSRKARSVDTALSAPQAAPAVEAGGFTPAVGAKETTMPVKLASGTLEMIPDQKLLSAPDTVFPVHIDPYVSGARNNWTAVSKSYPTTSYWNKTDNVARVGYESDTGGTWRSFFTMDSRNLNDANKTIVKSTFRISNTHSWSCTKKPVELWDTGTISSATTWNKQPAWSNKLATLTDAKGWGTGCPAGNLEFDNTANAKKAQAGKWTTMTLGLRASESDTFGWKKFDAKTAVVSTEYNTTPGVPNGLGTNPATQCNANPVAVIGNTDVQLFAKVADADGGTLQARFKVWPTGKPEAFFEPLASATSGTVARVTVSKGSFADRTPYTWQVRAEDGKAKSAFSATCSFMVLKDRPSHKPDVSSPQFPDGADGWPAGTSPIRTEGVFTIANGGAKDVESYEYSSSVDPTVRTLKPAKPGGDVTVKLTPMTVGSHTLTVRSLDRAGNGSDPQSYLFYANGLKTADKAGDINGDGHPDLWAVDGEGTLQRYFGDGTGKVTKAAEAASEKGAYKNAKITTRGDWTSNQFEDLVALIPDPVENYNRLWVHPNDGKGAIETAEKQKPTDEPKVVERELKVHEEENAHFREADQILAIGDVDGPLDLDGDGVIGSDDRPAHPDLIVKKGDHLWLYFGSSSNHLDEHLDQPPVLLGQGGWSNYDLMAPGDHTGNGRVDMLARSKTTGELRLYEGKGPEGQGLGNAHTVIGNGWTPAYRPLATAAPDITGDGRSGVWATGAGGELYFYPGIRGGGTAIGTSLKGYLDLG